MAMPVLRRVGALAAVLVLGLWGHVAAETAHVRAAVNMREGPSVRYPVIRVVPFGARVQVNACLRDLSWCDVTYGGDTGWVYATYLEIVAPNRRRVLLPRWGFVPGIAIIAGPPRIYVRPWRPHPPVIVVPPRPPSYRPPVYRPPYDRPPVYRPPVHRPPVRRPPDWDRDRRAPDLRHPDERPPAVRREERRDERREERREERRDERRDDRRAPVWPPEDSLREPDRR